MAASGTLGRYAATRSTAADTEPHQAGADAGDLVTQLGRRQRHPLASLRIAR